MNFQYRSNTNSLAHFQVSWIRKRDLHILTSMAHTYTSDARFTVIGNTETSDDWNLRIDSVQPRDEGIYECQVNTEPKIHRTLYLRVLGGISLIHTYIYFRACACVSTYVCAYTRVRELDLPMRKLRPRECRYVIFPRAWAVGTRELCSAREYYYSRIFLCAFAVSMEMKGEFSATAFVWPTSQPLFFSPRRRAVQNKSYGISRCKGWRVWREKIVSFECAESAKTNVCRVGLPKNLLNFCRNSSPL